MALHRFLPCVFSVVLCTCCFQHACPLDAAATGLYQEVEGTCNADVALLQQHFSMKKHITPIRQGATELAAPRTVLPFLQKSEPAMENRLWKLLAQLARNIGIRLVRDGNRRSLGSALHLKSLSVEVLDTPQSKEPTIPLDNPAKKIASPREIAIIFIALFMPIALAWVVYFIRGKPSSLYFVLLPITVVACTFAFDTSNQSLSAIVPSPMKITALHAAALLVLTGCWSLLADRRQLAEVASMRIVIRFASTVAVMYTVYQICNHYVSKYCTLSERIVFQNLTPAISLSLELFMMPTELQPFVNRRCRLALLCVAVGSALYCWQSSDLTLVGLMWASLLVLLMVPYRMTQRYIVAGEMKAVPVGFLACLDALVLLMPASVLGVTASNEAEGTVADFSFASTVVLAALTCLAYTLQHCSGLLMMHAGSATTFLVWYNVSNFAIIIASYFLYDDNIAETGLMAAGLFMSVTGCVWYSIEDINQKRAKNKQADAENGCPKAMEDAGDVIITKGS
eukprot:TRINITY_DN20413_c0_g1_i1.p1 TRINITY_DN20413_c0_g1~~TRINITY_DN20413_c0_g1_i1.p1  ORF type:complete len:511 (-),score=64.32 TRINITY_DN20413_c0_g1_i1:71-1603(-)